MSENARGKGRKRALGALGARQIPSVVQPSGMDIDELLTPEEMSSAPQMGQEETQPEEETPPPQRRRQQA